MIGIAIIMGSLVGLLFSGKVIHWLIRLLIAFIISIVMALAVTFFWTGNWNREVLGALISFTILLGVPLFLATWKFK